MYFSYNDDLADLSSRMLGWTAINCEAIAHEIVEPEIQPGSQ
jgi:hypothetical protein